MLTFENLYTTAQENQEKAYQLLINTIENGQQHQASTLLLLLSMYPQFKQQRYQISEDKLQNAPKVVEYLQNIQGKHSLYSVPFAYWLIKQNQQQVLINLVENTSKPETIFSPFQSYINKDNKIVFTYNAKYEGEKINKDNAENYLKNSTEISFTNNLLSRWQLSNLPSTVTPLSQRDLIVQLKPFYLDLSVSAFTKKLMQNRGIDIVNCPYGILEQDKRERIEEHVVTLEKGMDYNDPSWFKKLEERNNAASGSFGI